MSTSLTSLLRLARLASPTRALLPRCLPSLARPLSGGPPPPSVVPVPKPGVPGEVPSIFDQATGLERAEIENPDLFRHNEVLRGTFGTPDEPVLIQSNFDSRIVGCTGHAAPDDHDLHWINVEKGTIATCGQCEQRFKLDPI